MAFGNKCNIYVKFIILFLLEESKANEFKGNYSFIRLI